MGNLGGEAQKVRKRKKKVRRHVVVEPESQEQATNVNVSILLEYIHIIYHCQMTC